MRRQSIARRGVLASLLTRLLKRLLIGIFALRISLRIYKRRYSLKMTGCLLIILCFTITFGAMLDNLSAEEIIKTQEISPTSSTFSTSTTPSMNVNESSIPIHKYTLENGLKIIVQEDHRAPIVVSTVWYKVGGNYEMDGLTGISHALEHMMFKGTSKYGLGQFSKIIAENGGSQNAATSYDYTVYYQEVAKDKLPICLELEADRMTNLALKEEDFTSELQVVMEERRQRIDDNHEAFTRERFFASAFINSPRHHPVIGWETDIQNLTILDLKQWYKNWYAPNNAILVVVGDVKPKEVYALAKKYFTQPATKIPLKKPLTEVESTGLRRISVNRAAKVPYLILGYRVPSIYEVSANNAWEPYALIVLMTLMDGGHSSRLSERLVRKEGIASTTDSWYNPFQLNAGLMAFTATPSEGQTLATLEQSIIKELEALKMQPILDEELKRAKAMIIAKQTYKNDSMLEKAYELGNLESIGLPPELMQQYVNNIQAVTIEQIKALATKYLISERLTVAHLIPTQDK